jgi:Transposase DDE domain
MLPAEDLFVHCYVLVDDMIRDGLVQIPPRPGPAPACTDAEIVTISLVRHLLGRRSEAGFLAEIRREWPALFPTLPHSSEVNRRTRWLYGAFEQIRQALLAAVPADDWGQIDTSALPVKHPSRVRGPDSWTGPNELCARFGRDAAHGEWFYGFRLAVRTDLGTRLVRAWAIVPAALNERDLVPDLTAGADHLVGLLNDKGFNGRAFTAYLAEHGLVNLVPPAKKQRTTMPTTLQKIIAEWRNRIETTFGELTDIMELARHGAHTFHGLLTRTAATIAAHSLAKIALPAA